MPTIEFINKIHQLTAELDATKAKLRNRESQLSEYRSLLAEIGTAVNCLSSVFPDGNKHIVEAVQLLAKAKP